MRRLTSTFLLLATCVLVGCGEETDREPAVEAREGNDALVGAFSYRVVLFRELNRATTTDRALLESVPTSADQGLYAAFIEACNRSDERQTPTSSIVLEDAFGETWQPVREGLEPSLTYQPRPLEPGMCLPEPGSVATQTFDGTAVVFAVPYSSTHERPLILEIRQSDEGDSARLELDL